MLPTGTNVGKFNQAITAIHANEASITGLLESELAEWKRREVDISSAWEWYDGTKLSEEDRGQPLENNEFPKLYPLQFNPIRSAAKAHAAALIGELQDTKFPPVRPQALTDDERLKTIAEKATRIVEHVDYENGFRAMFMDMALAIQGLGGIAIKVGWEPNDPTTRPSGIRLEYFDPRTCYFRVTGTDYFNIDEAWVRYGISKAEALKLGVQIVNDFGTYYEYWNRDHYWIKIDGQIASDANGVPYDRDHKFGLVPFIYIPHDRANAFWGTPISIDSIGMVKEENARLADIGDAVREGVHGATVGRNIRSGFPVLRQLRDDQGRVILEYIDMGRAAQGEPEPEMIRMNPPNLPNAAPDFAKTVLNNLRTSMDTPSIAYGEEEGTQRSGQTLYSRMWPLISHTARERAFWTEGMNRKEQIIMRILFSMQGASGLNVPEVTEDYLSLMWQQSWTAPLPVDRSQLVQELTMRLEAGLVSPATAIAQFSDASDINKEQALIREWMTFKAKLESLKRPEPATGQANGDGVRARQHENVQQHKNAQEGKTKNVDH